MQTSVGRSFGRLVIMFRNLASVLLLAALAGPVAAQSPMPDVYDPGRSQLSREQLQSLLQSYTAGSKNTAYTAAYRERTKAQTQLIKDRLENGDIQVGDKVELVVEGQAPLTATFNVDPGRVLVLPAIGPIPVAGVLRSELETHLTKQISRFVVEPVVHAHSLVRVTILGAVNKPGFFVVPAQSLIPDVLMLAGGPSGTANMQGIKVTRGGKTIWDGNTLQAAIVDGWTLDQLSLRAGDQIEVPAQASRNFVNIARTVLMSVGPTVLLLRLLHII